MVIKNGRKKRIVFIESKSPGSHIFSMVLLPRIGPLLFSAIMKTMGYEVTVIVENFHKINWKVVKEADLVCISIITCTSIGGYEIAKKCKEMGKMVIIGGSHATFLPEESARYADYVCIGEAEWSFPELAKAILEGDIDPKKVKGIAYIQDGALIKTEPAREVTAKDLDDFPFPDFSLIYGKPKMRITPIMSSRGCPYNCKFCSVTRMFGRNMRYRSEDVVIEEIKHQKPNYIFFYDDNFTINKKRTTSILEKMMKIPAGNRPTWSAQVSTEIAENEELIKLMKKSGCEYVYVGFESISDTTLDAYNKKQNKGKIKEFMEAFRRNNINVHGMFVFSPESDDSSLIDETLKLIKEEKIATVQLLIMTPLPGTPFWTEKKGDFLTEDWSLFDAHHIVVPAQKMTSYEMQMKTVKAMKEFYSLSRAWSAFCNGNILAAKFRALGWNIARKWEGNNEEYLNYLRLLGEFSENFKRR